MDEFYMKKALILAHKAYLRGEIPVGAVVVSEEGAIIGKGYNRTETEHSQSRHAEVAAVEQAGENKKDWRLTGCTLYVTLQPCLMCMSLICLGRITRLVYGAESTLYGYALDNESLPCLYKKHIRGITAGVLAEDSKKLMEQFFKGVRKRSEQF